MPRKYELKIDAYKLTAFIHRPLIWLLPFFMAGIYMGWHRPENIKLYSYLAWAAAFIAFTVSFFRVNYYLWSFSLVVCVIFLGSFLISWKLQPPLTANSLYQLDFKSPVILEGLVKKSQARPDGSGHRLIIEGTAVIEPGDEEGNYIQANGLARINVGGVLKELEVGDYVRFPVLLKPIKGFKNPGLNDLEKYWQAQNIWVGGFVKSPWLITSWPADENKSIVKKLRIKSADFLRSNSMQPATGLLASMLIGQRQAVDKNSEDIFRKLGLSHILSVSGLHLSLWYGVCFFIARRLIQLITHIANIRISLNIAAAIAALFPALFYAALAGSEPPVLRSAIMISLATGALLSRRGVDIYNVLALAAWAVLSLEPQRLMSASFQLSFTATLAMVAIFRVKKSPDKVRHSLLFQPLNMTLLKSLLRGKAENNKSSHRFPFIRGLGLASVAGTFGTAPLVVWHFGYLPIAGLAANLFFTFIMSVFSLVPGLISLLLLHINETAASWLLGLSADSLMLLMPILEKIAQISGPGIMLPAPCLFFIICYYIAMILIFGRYLKFKTRLIVCLGILMLGFTVNYFSRDAFSGNLKISALDVGQGSSIHISFPEGTQMLVDGGGTFYFDPGESLITPYLLRQGINRLDIVALTHPHQDHLKGLATVAEKFRPKQTWSAPWQYDSSALYEDFLKNTALSERPSWPELFGRHYFGPVKVQIMWPPAKQKWSKVTKPQFNNFSMVMRIQWAESSFLLTGDIEKETEAALVDLYGAELKSTILMAPHHGSRNSLSKEFIHAVAPACIVFSVGRENNFNLPHPEALHKAESAGADIWRTDLHGAAVFEVQNKNGQVNLKSTGPCFAKQDTLK